MSIDAARYRPPVASERLLPKTIHGYNGCRLSAAWSGAAVATLGESTLLPNGRLKGVAARKRDLERMLRATGEPNRVGFNQSHVPAIHDALGVPTPEPWTGTFEELWRDEGAAFTIAGNPQDIAGASTLERLAAQRGWSGADHELLLLPRRGTHGTIIDPMRPQGGSYSGDRVPKAEVRQFMRSREIEAGGRPVAERYPVGGWTQAALATRRLRRRLDEAEEQAEATQKRLRARIAALEAGSGAPVDHSLAVGAALEHERVVIRDLVDERRSL